MERNKAIDIAKAIAIILMVVGHCESLHFLISKWIFSFHLPLFFIFSGYFFKQKPIKKVFQSGLSSLVQPYIIATLICTVIAYVCRSPEAALNRIEGSFVGCMGASQSIIKYSSQQAGPIWFLLALFWCRVYFAIVYKFNSKSYLIISAILSIAFWRISVKFINLPLCIGSGFTSLFFYAIGFWMKDKIDYISKSKLCGMSMFWAVAVVLSYLNMAQYIYHRFYLCVPAAIFGTILVYQFSKIVPDRIGSFFSIVGQETLAILCCHSYAFVSREYILNIIGFDSTSIYNKDYALLILTILYTGFYLYIKKILRFKNIQKNVSKA